MKKLLRLLASVFVSVGLTTGIAAAATGTIGTTGPLSDNSIVWENDSNVDLDNNTSVDADVNVNQEASSGHAGVVLNTTGGDAESGDADNSSEFEADLSIDNSGSSSAAMACGCGGGGDDEATIDTTGPGSNNHIVFNNSSNVSVSNNTSVDYDHSVNQTAETGWAVTAGNTTGGNATSGSASNSSSSSFSLSVTN